MPTAVLAVALVFTALAYLLSLGIDRLLGYRHDAARWRVAVHHLPEVLFGAACTIAVIRLRNEPVQFLIAVLVIITVSAAIGTIVDRLVGVTDRHESSLRTAVHHIPFLLLGWALTGICLG